MLREDGLRGALRHTARSEPPEARTTLTLVSRAHLDAAFHQARRAGGQACGGQPHGRPERPQCGMHAERPCNGARAQRQRQRLILRSFGLLPLHEPRSKLHSAPPGCLLASAPCLPSPERSSPRPAVAGRLLLVCAARWPLRAAPAGRGVPQVSLPTGWAAGVGVVWCWDGWRSQRGWCRQRATGPRLECGCAGWCFGNVSHRRPGGQAARAPRIIQGRPSLRIDMQASGRPDASAGLACTACLIQVGAPCPQCCTLPGSPWLFADSTSGMVFDCVALERL